MKIQNITEDFPEVLHSWPVPSPLLLSQERVSEVICELY